MSPSGRSSVVSSLALACALAALSCGDQEVGRPGDRISNGEFAEPSEFPFMVRLEVFVGGKWKHDCGGSIIDQNYILTAAYCVRNELQIVEPSQIRVKLGCHNLKECSETHELSKIIVHPDYRGGNNDVAVLVVNRKIKFNQNVGLGSVGKIRLAEKLQDDEKWGNLTVIGWGHLENSVYPDILRKVHVAAIPHSKCKQSLPIIGEDEICAVKRDEGSYEGDSGSPLFKTLDDGTRLQVGIVSRDGKRGTSEVGGIYTRVASFYSWILKTSSAPADNLN